MKILIIKFGALGDVVRTSYFASSLHKKYGNHLELTWITSKAAKDLLIHNPFITRLVFSFSDISSIKYDIVYSLDDEEDIVRQAVLLDCSKFVGANFYNDKLTYTEDCSEWFDMGLLSKFGKEKADSLKKLNTRGHAQIFKDIFSVENVSPNIHGVDNNKYHHMFVNKPIIAINPYAGGRWPSKELRCEEILSLSRLILNTKIFKCGRLLLLGGGDDLKRNKINSHLISDSRLCAVDTNSSILDLAAIISGVDLLITSDSLALHLAIAQRVPSVAFFAPTSAAEIDSFESVYKLISTSDDYCSYAKDADNSSITADKLFGLCCEHFKQIEYKNNDENFSR